MSKLGGKYLGNIIPMIVPLKREGKKEGKLLIKLKDKQIRERKNAFTKSCSEVRLTVQPENTGVCNAGRGHEY